MLFRSIRDIERVCHTRIKERKIPSAADITSRKAAKILKEAVRVAEQQDISRATGYILDEIALGEHSAVEIAAAFMQMKLGAEIEDIKSEKFTFDKRAGSRGRGRENRNSGRGGKRENYDRRSGQRSDRGRQRGGDKNSYYASLRVKTKKQS